MGLCPDSLTLGRCFFTELYCTPGWVRYANTERKLEALLEGRLSGAWASSLRKQVTHQKIFRFKTISCMFEIVSSFDTLPYFICHLFFVATLVAAADQEPDEKQEEEQQQESTYHCPDYDTHLIGSWKKRHGALLCLSLFFVIMLQCRMLILNVTKVPNNEISDCKSNPCEHKP